MHPGSLPAHIQSCSPLASSLKVHPLTEHSTHMHFVQEDLRVEGLLLSDSHHSQRYHRGGRSCTQCTASDRFSPPVTDWPRTACTTGGLHGTPMFTSTHSCIDIVCCTHNHKHLCSKQESKGSTVCTIMATQERVRHFPRYFIIYFFTT